MSKYFALSLLAAVPLLIVASPATAQVDSGLRGKTLWDAEGKRVGVISRVNENGTVLVIAGSRLVTIAGATVTNKDGRVATSLTRKEIARL